MDGILKSFCLDSVLNVIYIVISKLPIRFFFFFEANCLFVKYAMYVHMVYLLQFHCCMIGLSGML